VDKNVLLNQTVPSGPVDIPGIGTVTVRGMTRYEMQMLGKIEAGDEVKERKILAMTMVDPTMSEGDVEAWQMCSPAGQINRVAMEVNRLSGIGRDAEKEAYKSVRDDAGA
jgi:hypothetical protein